MCRAYHLVRQRCCLILDQIRRVATGACAAFRIFCILNHSLKLRWQHPCLAVVSLVLLFYEILFLRLNSKLCGVTSRLWNGNAALNRIVLDRLRLQHLDDLLFEKIFLALLDGLLGDLRRIVHRAIHLRSFCSISLNPIVWLRHDLVYCFGLHFCSDGFFGVGVLLFGA